MQTDAFRAGIARVDITPPLGMWLAGYAARDHSATGIHDHLHATALVLQCGETKTALVSCDLLALDAGDVAAIRRLAADATGIQAENILIHCIHTHSGPLVCNMFGFGARDKEYESVLIRQVATAIRLADSRLQPAELAFGLAEAKIGLNRRHKRNGQMSIGANPDGPVDHRIGALGVYAPGSRTLNATVIWAAVHPVLFGSDNYSFGRDFPGYALDLLERAYPGSTAMWLTGTCGDVNPRREPSEDKFTTACKAGEMAAGAAIQALAGGRLLPGKLATAQHQLKMPLAPLPSESELLLLKQQQEERLRAAGGDLAQRLSLDGPFQWILAALAAVRNEPSSLIAVKELTVELQAIAIGDLVLTALPFEVFTEYGQLAAKSAPGANSLVVGYGNGDYGYLPTAAAFAEGGYEVVSAPKYYKLPQFSPDAQAVVMAGLAELHGKLAARMQ